MDEVQWKPLGPTGIHRRIAELEARIDQTLGGSSDPSFSNVLEGQITSDHNALNKPVNPMTMGTAIAPDRVALKKLAAEAAVKYGLDPNLFDAVIQTESGFNPNSGSGKGAIGLSQLMPGTARSLGADPYEPMQNLEAGAKYLKEQMDHYGNLQLALAAYNAGPGAVAKAHGIPPFKETQSYIKRVLAEFEKNKISGLNEANQP